MSNSLFDNNEIKPTVIKTINQDEIVEKKMIQEAKKIKKKRIKNENKIDINNFSYVYVLKFKSYKIGLFKWRY